MSATKREGATAHNESELLTRAAWRRVEPDAVRRFIESQPDIRGAIELVEIAEPTNRAGMSNGILLLKVALDVGQGREVRDLVLRYSPSTSTLKQKNFSDEFWTARAAKQAGIPAPWPLWLDAEGEMLGTPGLVMERIHGETAAAGLYSAGAIAEATPEARKAMLLDVAGIHGRLRRTAIGPDKLPHLLKRGAGSTEIERELSWLLEEARLNTDSDDRKRDDISSVYEWLCQHQPSMRPGSLVHGDVQVANTMFREDKIVGWLDWELSYIGHGETDLALLIYYTHLLKIYDKDIPGTPSADEYIRAFEAEAGCSVECFEYFRLFAMYKLTCLILCTVKVMPNFEEYWDHVWHDLTAAWQSAKSIF